MTEVDFFYSYFYDHVSVAFSNSNEMNEMAKYYLEKCCNVLENTAIIRMLNPYNSADSKTIVPVFFENKQGDLLYSKKIECVADEQDYAMVEANAFVQNVLTLCKQPVKVISD